MTTKQIESYIYEKSGIELSSDVDQYLRTTDVPVFTYKIKNNSLTYRWQNCVDDFDMKVKVSINGKETWLSPTTSWKTEKISSKITDVEVDENFYVETEDNSK